MAMKAKSKKRPGARVARTPKAAKVAYKKCLVGAIKKAKIRTPKQARKVFNAAAKKCRLMCLVKKVCRTKTGAPLKTRVGATKAKKKTGMIRVRKPGGGYYYRKRPSRR